LVLPSVLGQQQRRFLFDLVIPKERHIVFYRLLPSLGSVFPLALSFRAFSSSSPSC
jgi:hypothetical protein